MAGAGLAVAALAGCGGGPGTAVRLTIPSSLGSITGGGYLPLFQRHGPDHTTITAEETADTTDLPGITQPSCPQFLAAEVQWPHHTKLYQAMRNRASSGRALTLVQYLPYDGVLVAYADAAVSRIQWRTANGEVDAMPTEDGWAVEVGPAVPEPHGPGPSPLPVGELVGLGAHGKVVSRIVVSSADTQPLCFAVNGAPVTVP